MGESPLLAEWTSCPRCRRELRHEARAVRCASCGLSAYGTPAPTASAIILDEEGRVLLARRKNDPGAGLWDLLGGFVEEGEDGLSALRREIEEETALRIEPLEFLGAFPDRYGDEGIYTLNLYWCARVTGGELDLDGDELLDVAWFSPGELPPESEFAFANTFQALQAWKSELGSAGRGK
jgi:ADP-ribose pyrophosphatase YjhB (NUDIX family)